jgi:hypothetical protein
MTSIYYLQLFDPMNRATEGFLGVDQPRLLSHDSAASIFCTAHRDMTPDSRHIIPVAVRCTFGTRERYALRSLAVLGHNVPCGARNLFYRVHE